MPRMAIFIDALCSNEGILKPVETVQLRTILAQITPPPVRVALGHNKNRPLSSLVDFSPPYACRESRSAALNARPGLETQRPADSTANFPPWPSAPSG